MNYYREIKDRVTVRDICDLYGIRVDNHGFANCPFHTERTASLKVYPDDRGFHCFGCGKTGDVIDFAKELNHISAHEAAELINNEMHLGLSIGRPMSLSERLRADRIARERAREREKEDAEYKALKDAYDRDLSVYAAFDLIKMQFAPLAVFDGGDGELDPVYMDAVQNLDRAAYRLDCSEAALREYEMEHKK